MPLYSHVDGLKKKKKKILGERKERKRKIKTRHFQETLSAGKKITQTEKDNDKNDLDRLCS